MSRLLSLPLALALALSLSACQKSATPSETPKAETPKAETPKAETPKAETPKAAHDEHAAHAAHAKEGQEPAATSAKRVFFVSPKAGEKVKSPVKVVFGVEGMGVRPAGEDVTDQTTGHHHIIVDGAFVPKGTVVPKDEKHIHFGGGQTETELKLTPGKHTLTMQLADGAHISYGEGLSATLEVEVTE